MNKNELLYAIAAIFKTPDQIINAAEKVAGSGYKEWDVNTPYPVHGMDSAMKLKPSKLGFFALAFGLMGAAIAFFGMSYIMTIVYPLNIGGKPFLPAPAFIPITFELTVLLASVGTVAAMIVLYFKFPNNAHPLHDTDYMKKVSIDKYGIYIKKDDPEFDEEKIRKLYEDLGAEEIQEIHWDEQEISFTPKVFEKKFIMILAFSAIVASATTYLLWNKLAFSPPFDWMSDQPRLNAQSTIGFFEDGYGMRLPVDGTVSRNNLPYEYYGQPDSAAIYMVNPLPVNDENLKKGEEKYNTFCSPCHGYFGKGESRLRGQFPNPPSLHSEKSRNWSDGRFYHVIMEGQNIMPSYASQMTEEERWQTIIYIRALQRALNAKEEDLK